MPETCSSWKPSHIVSLVTCPVLAVYASKDVQVPMRENVLAARALGKKNWTIVEMPDMNHAFQRCTTGMPDEYPSVDHVIAREDSRRRSQWIRTTIPA